MSLGFHGLGFAGRNRVWILSKTEAICGIHWRVRGLELNASLRTSWSHFMHLTGIRQSYLVSLEGGFERH